MSYEPESGTYYSFNSETNEYVYHSQIEPTVSSAHDPKVRLNYY